MRMISLVLALLLSLSAPSAMAQSEAPAPVEAVAAQAPATTEGAGILSGIQTELDELIEEVRGLQTPGSLTAGQAFGFAAGVVVGAIVADTLGGGGLVTLALALSGGAVGSWIMSD